MAAPILVPLDGSRFAEKALSCALGLGKGQSAELVLFRAVPTPQSAHRILLRAGQEASEAVGGLAAKAGNYLRNLAGSLSGMDLDVRYVVGNGSPAKAIADYARQIEARQIVMATHGPRGIRDSTRGSVAEHVVQSSRTPVLMVNGRRRDLTDPRQPRACCRVVVPLDGSKRAEQVLPPVSRLAKDLGCEVALFQVSPVFLLESSTDAARRMTKSYLDEVARPLREQGIKVSVATGTGLVAQSIVHFAESTNSDLIAMSTRGRMGIARWTLGSVADRVLTTGRTPVLLVRAPRRPLLN